MQTQEAIEVMNRCAHEITRLRDEVERLRPQADAYASIERILRLLPQPSQGYGPDLVWDLQKRIKDLQAPVPEAAA